MKRIVLLIFLAAATPMLSLALSHGQTPVADAAFPSAELSSMSQMYCLPNNSVSLLLRWTTGNVGPQWVDISPADDQFGPGTFIGNGPLSASQSSLIWNGLQPATWYFVRINTLTPFGWFPSETRAYYTRDDCSPSIALLSIPPSQACLTALTTPFLAGCVYSAKPDFASYAPGETVVYCYTLNQAANVRIVATKPDGTRVGVIDGFDGGTGACVGPYQAADPLGPRTVDLYGGPGYQLLAEEHFAVQ